MDKKLEAARSYFGNDRFAALAGIEILEADNGYCLARLTIADHHLNAAGVVQGGAIFTLADLAFAVAANSHGRLALAISASIMFLHGKRQGELLATAREMSEPHRLGAYEVVVTDETGLVVATFSGLVYRKNEANPLA